MRKRKRRKEVRGMVVQRETVMVLIMKRVRKRGQNMWRRKKWMELSLRVKDEMIKRTEVETKEKIVQVDDPRKSPGATRRSLSVQAITTVIVTNICLSCIAFPLVSHEL